MISHAEILFWKVWRNSYLIFEIFKINRNTSFLDEDEVIFHLLQDGNFKAITYSYSININDITGSLFYDNPISFSILEYGIKRGLGKDMNDDHIDFCLQNNRLDLAKKIYTIVGHGPCISLCSIYCSVYHKRYDILTWIYEERKNIFNNAVFQKIRKISNNDVYIDNWINCRL